jgi:hypothetical protein
MTLKEFILRSGVKFYGLLPPSAKASSATAQAAVRHFVDFIGR